MIIKPKREDVKWLLAEKVYLWLNFRIYNDFKFFDLQIPDN